MNLSRVQVGDKSPSSMEVYKVEAAYIAKPFNSTLIFHILFFFLTSGASQYEFV